MRGLRVGPSGDAGKPARVLLLTATLAGSAVGVAAGQTVSGNVESVMRIEIEVEGATIAAILEDSPAGRDFAALLPLTLTLDDYHATEKISDLPRRLSIEGAPAGFDPLPGDLAYYAPWGNLAVFYKDFGYSPGLVKLGAIVAGADALQGPGSLAATFRRAE